METLRYLDAWCDEKKLSYSRLARRTYLSPSTVRAIVRGGPARPATVALLAQGLNISIRQLRHAPPSYVAPDLPASPPTKVDPPKPAARRCDFCGCTGEIQAMGHRIGVLYLCASCRGRIVDGRAQRAESEQT